MDIATTLVDDSAIVDGLETVTVYDVSAATSCADVPALSSALSYRELAANGGAGYEPTDQAWRLWTDNLTFVPAQGDSITTAAGVVWTILSVGETNIGPTPTSYRCTCRKQV